MSCWSMMHSSAGGFTPAAPLFSMNTCPLLYVLYQVNQFKGNKMLMKVTSVPWKREQRYNAWLCTVVQLHSWVRLRAAIELRDDHGDRCCVCRRELIIKGHLPEGVNRRVFSQAVVSHTTCVVPCSSPSGIRMNSPNISFSSLQQHL